MKFTSPSGEVLMTFQSKGVISQESLAFQEIEAIPRSNEGFTDLGKTQYKPVGKCIYCGATSNLSREHIVPFGLSGTAVLPEASCKNCASITSAFELKVLRGAMRDVRVFRKLRSRSKHEGKSQTQHLKIERNGCCETVELPIKEYPILLHFWTFAEPGVLCGYEGTGIQVNGVATVQFGPDPQIVGKKLGAQKITFDSQPDHPVAFAKMIGKIGYAMAVAMGAIKLNDHRPEIVASILGEVDEIGKWVGTLPGKFHQYPDGTLHRIIVRQDPLNGVLVEIQLFADSSTPSYIVVIR